MRAPYSGLRSLTPNPVVCGRKFCAMCGRWRPQSDFSRDPRNYVSGLRSYCHTCDRLRRRRWWAQATPEQRQVTAEYRRFWRDAKRVEAGLPSVAWRGRHTVIDRIERLFLDPGPLVALLDSYPDAEFSVLARRAGVSERAIYRLRYGESLHVRLDLADKLALAMGSHLYALYGDVPLVRLQPGRAA